MSWRSPKVSPQKELSKGEISSGVTIRRTEIVVERSVCTIDLHGSISLHAGDRCPVCGHTFDLAEAEAAALARGQAPPELPKPKAHGETEPSGDSI
jgi:hypothetical protein